MTTSSKLFWGFFAVELTVAGIIGWKIAHAQTHPWQVKPKTRRPNPLPLQVEILPLPAQGPRGRRRKRGSAHDSLVDVAHGTITIEEVDDLRTADGRSCGVGHTDADGNFVCDFGEGWQEKRDAQRGPR
jgi:hypothetical protein